MASSKLALVGVVLAPLFGSAFHGDTGFSDATVPVSEGRLVITRFYVRMNPSFMSVP